MFNSTRFAIGVSKPLSIFIKLADGDENKIDKVKKIMRIISIYLQEVSEKC